MRRALRAIAALPLVLPATASTQRYDARGRTIVLAGSDGSGPSFLGQGFGG